MASYTFRKKPSQGDVVNRYSVNVDNLGRGLPRKRPLTTAEIMTLKPSPRFNYPTGVDTKVPRLPGGR